MHAYIIGDGLTKPTGCIQWQRLQNGFRDVFAQNAEWYPGTAPIMGVLRPPAQLGLLQRMRLCTHDARTWCSVFRACTVRAFLSFSFAMEPSKTARYTAMSVPWQYMKRYLPSSVAASSELRTRIRRKPCTTATTRESEVEYDSLALHYAPYLVTPTPTPPFGNLKYAVPVKANIVVEISSPQCITSRGPSHPQLFPLMIDLCGPLSVEPSLPSGQTPTPQQFVTYTDTIRLLPTQTRLRCHLRQHDQGGTHLHYSFNSGKAARLLSGQRSASPAVRRIFLERCHLTNVATHT